VCTTPYPKCPPHSEDNEDVPVDVVYFLETAEDGNTWIPRSHEVQKLLEDLTEDLNDVINAIAQSEKE
jgi:hypothetical protein